MNNNEKTLRQLFQSKGYNRNQTDALIEQLKNMENPSDLLTRILASENLGKTSEEKVFKNGNIEIPFSKTEIDAEMGINGDVQEKRKEFHYSSNGNLVDPPAYIDKHNHIIPERDTFDCIVCLKKGCSDCMIFSVDRFGFVKTAYHRECLICSECNEPSEDFERFSDMIIVRDEFNNIVECYHKKCGLLERILNFFFKEKINDSSNVKLLNRHVDEIETGNNGRKA